MRTALGTISTLRSPHLSPKVGAIGFRAYERGMGTSNGAPFRRVQDRPVRVHQEFAAPERRLLQEAQELDVLDVVDVVEHGRQGPLRRHGQQHRFQPMREHQVRASRQAALEQGRLRRARHVVEARLRRYREHRLDVAGQDR
jgi:hypothetical protein